MMFKGKIGIYFENHTKDMNKIWEKVTIVIMLQQLVYILTTTRL
jgi:hypothetical protein